MPSEIPFVPGDPEQKISITLDGEPYVMRARWNTSDDDGAGAWYLDVWERDGKTAIALGIKLVLGTKLGITFNHPLFVAGLLMYRTEGSGEARLQDLGGRVILVHMTVGDAIISAALPPAAA